MRILFFLFLILAFTSCDHPKKPYIEELTWPKRTVKLDNDLGILTIRLPEEFDTFYTFRYESDNICGDYKKYRFQNSKFPVLKESGGYISHTVDSLKIFTIEQNIYACSEGITMDSLKLKIITKNHIEHLKANDRSRSPILKMSRIDTFNGKPFFIIAHENGELYHIKDSVKNLKSAKLMTYTRVNKYHILNLNFDCAASNCDSFIPKMYKALKTVQIKPN